MFKFVPVAFILVTPLLAPCMAATSADAAARIEKTLAAPDRPAKDRERDAKDKTVEILKFADFKPGMVVADVFAGGGYYSETIADVVGDGGSVFLLNNTGYQQYAREAIKERFVNRKGPANVKQRVFEPKKMDLGEKTLDAAIMVMAYHDMYWVDEKEGWPAVDADAVLKQIHAALKPNGFFLVIDHSAGKGTGKAPAQTLHRIDEAFAKKDIESHGFKLEKTFDGLRNPSDDTSKAVFDPAVRGKTDRFVHLYRRL